MTVKTLKCLKKRFPASCLYRLQLFWLNTFNYIQPRKMDHDLWQNLYFLDVSTGLFLWQMLMCKCKTLYFASKNSHNAQINTNQERCMQDKKVSCVQFPGWEWTLCMSWWICVSLWFWSWVKTILWFLNGQILACMGTWGSRSWITN